MSKKRDERAFDLPLSGAANPPLRDRPLLEACRPSVCGLGNTVGASTCSGVCKFAQEAAVNGLVHEALTNMPELEGTAHRVSHEDAALSAPVGKMALVRTSAIKRQVRSFIDDVVQHCPGCIVIGAIHPRLIFDEPGGETWRFLAKMVIAGVDEDTLEALEARSRGRRGEAGFRKVRAAAIDDLGSAIRSVLPLRCDASRKVKKDSGKFGRQLQRVDDEDRLLELKLWLNPVPIRDRFILHGIRWPKIRSRQVLLQRRLFD